MNHVLAKISRNKGLLKVISDKTIYNSISYNENYFIDYSYDHNLDEECWFKIANFSEKDFCLDFLKENQCSINFASIEKKDYENIKYIVSVQDNDNYYFQKIAPRSLLKKKSIFYMGDCVELLENYNLLIINNIPDAIYFKSEDILIF